MNPLILLFWGMIAMAPHSVTLNWDKAPATSSPVVAYNIKRQDTPGGPFVSIGTAPTNTYVDADPTLVEGKQYSYEVLADNAQVPPGESGPSNIVVVVIPFRIPDAPTGLVGKPN